MANISTTSLGLTLDTSSYTKNLKSTQRSTSVVLKSLNDQAQVFSDSWADITKNLRSAKSVASSMALYGTFTAIATGASLATIAIADFSANMENAKISMQYFIDGADKATQSLAYLREMQALAAKTSFTTESAINLSKFMASMGVDIRATKSVMTVINDAAAATGASEQRMQSIVTAMGQILTKGRLAAEEVRQLANANIPIYDILQEQLNLTGDQIKNIGNYWIDADKAVVAILTGLETRYKGAADDIANTMAGMVNSIKDNSLMISQIATSGIYDAAAAKVYTLRDALASYRDIAVNQGSSALFRQLLLDIDASGEIGTQILALVGNIRDLMGAFKELYISAKPLISVGAKGLYYQVTTLTVATTAFVKVLNVGAEALDKMGISSDTAIKALSGLYITYKVARMFGTVGQAAAALTMNIYNMASSAINSIPAIAGLSTAWKYGIVGALGLGSAVFLASGALDALANSIAGLNASGDILPSDYEEQFAAYQQAMEEYNSAITAYSDGFDKAFTSIAENGATTFKMLQKKSETAAKKSADSWLASFDEVFKVPEDKDTGTDKKDKDAFPDLSGLLHGLTFKFPTIESKAPEMPTFNWSSVYDQNTLSTAVAGGMSAATPLLLIGLSTLFGNAFIRKVADENAAKGLNAATSLVTTGKLGKAQSELQQALSDQAKANKALQAYLQKYSTRSIDSIDKYALEELIDQATEQNKRVADISKKLGTTMRVDTDDITKANQLLTRKQLSDLKAQYDDIQRLIHEAQTSSTDSTTKIAALNDQLKDIQKQMHKAYNSLGDIAEKGLVPDDIAKVSMGLPSKNVTGIAAEIRGTVENIYKKASAFDKYAPNIEEIVRDAVRPQIDTLTSLVDDLHTLEKHGIRISEAQPLLDIVDEFKAANKNLTALDNLRVLANINGRGTYADDIDKAYRALTEAANALEKHRVLFDATVFAKRDADATDAFLSNVYRLFTNNYGHFSTEHFDTYSKTNKILNTLSDNANSLTEAVSNAIHGDTTIKAYKTTLNTLALGVEDAQRTFLRSEFEIIARRLDDAARRGESSAELRNLFDTFYKKALTNVGYTRGSESLEGLLLERFYAVAEDTKQDITKLADIMRRYANKNVTVDSAIDALLKSNGAIVQTELTDTLHKVGKVLDKPAVVYPAEKFREEILAALPVSPDTYNSRAYTRLVEFLDKSVEGDYPKLTNLISSLANSQAVNPATAVSKAADTASNARLAIELDSPKALKEFFTDGIISVFEDSRFKLRSALPSDVSIIGSAVDRVSESLDVFSASFNPEKMLSAVQHLDAQIYALTKSTGSATLANSAISSNIGKYQKALKDYVVRTGAADIGDAGEFVRAYGRLTELQGALSGATTQSIVTHMSAAMQDMAKTLSGIGIGTTDDIIKAAVQEMHMSFSTLQDFRSGAMNASTYEVLKAIDVSQSHITEAFAGAVPDKQLTRLLAASRGDVTSDDAWRVARVFADISKENTHRDIAFFDDAVKNFQARFVESFPEFAADAERLQPFADAYANTFRNVLEGSTSKVRIYAGTVNEDNYNLASAILRETQKRYRDQTPLNNFISELTRRNKAVTDLNIVGKLPDELRNATDALISSLSSSAGTVFKPSGHLLGGMDVYTMLSGQSQYGAIIANVLNREVLPEFVSSASAEVFSPYTQAIMARGQVIEDTTLDALRMRVQRMFSDTGVQVVPGKILSDVDKGLIVQNDFQMVDAQSKYLGSVEMKATGKEAFADSIRKYFASSFNEAGNFFDLNATDAAQLKNMAPSWYFQMLAQADVSGAEYGTLAIVDVTKLPNVDKSLDEALRVAQGIKDTAAREEAMKQAFRMWVSQDVLQNMTGTEANNLVNTILRITNKTTTGSPEQKFITKSVLDAVTQYIAKPMDATVEEVAQNLVDTISKGIYNKRTFKYSSIKLDEKQAQDIIAAFTSAVHTGNTKAYENAITLVRFKVADVPDDMKLVATAAANYRELVQATNNLYAATGNIDTALRPVLDNGTFLAGTPTSRLTLRGAVPSFAYGTGNSPNVRVFGTEKSLEAYVGELRDLVNNADEAISKEAAARLRDLPSALASVGEARDSNEWATVYSELDSKGRKALEIQATPRALNAENGTIDKLSRYIDDLMGSDSQTLVTMREMLRNFDGYYKEFIGAAARDANVRPDNFIITVGKNRKVSLADYARELSSEVQKWERGLYSDAVTNLSRTINNDINNGSFRAYESFFNGLLGEGYGFADAGKTAEAIQGAVLNGIRGATPEAAAYLAAQSNATDVAANMLSEQNTANAIANMRNFGQVDEVADTTRALNDTADTLQDAADALRAGAEEARTTEVSVETLPEQMAAAHKKALEEALADMRKDLSNKGVKITADSDIYTRIANGADDATGTVRKAVGRYALSGQSSSILPGTQALSAKDIWKKYGFFNGFDSYRVNDTLVDIFSNLFAGGDTQATLSKMFTDNVIGLDNTLRNVSTISARKSAIRAAQAQNLSPEALNKTVASINQWFDDLLRRSDALFTDSFNSVIKSYDKVFKDYNAYMKQLRKANVTTDISGIRAGADTELNKLIDNAISNLEFKPSAAAETFYDTIIKTTTSKPEISFDEALEALRKRENLPDDLVAEIRKLNAPNKYLNELVNLRINKLPVDTNVAGLRKALTGIENILATDNKVSTFSGAVSKYLSESGLDDATRRLLDKNIYAVASNTDELHAAVKVLENVDEISAATKLTAITEALQATAKPASGLARVGKGALRGLGHAGNAVKEFLFSSVAGYSPLDVIFAGIDFAITDSIQKEYVEQYTSSLRDSLAYAIAQNDAYGDISAEALAAYSGLNEAYAQALGDMSNYWTRTAVDLGAQVIGHFAGVWAGAAAGSTAGGPIGAVIGALVSVAFSLGQELMGFNTAWGVAHDELEDFIINGEAYNNLLNRGLSSEEVFKYGSIANQNAARTLVETMPDAWYANTRHENQWLDLFSSIDMSTLNGLQAYLIGRTGKTNSDAQLEAFKQGDKKATFTDYTELLATEGFIEVVRNLSDDVWLFNNTQQNGVGTQEYNKAQFAFEQIYTGAILDALNSNTDDFSNFATEALQAAAANTELTGDLAEQVRNTAYALGDTGSLRQLINKLYGVTDLASDASKAVFYTEQAAKALVEYNKLQASNTVANAAVYSLRDTSNFVDYQTSALSSPQSSVFSAEADRIKEFADAAGLSISALNDFTDTLNVNVSDTLWAVKTNGDEFVKRLDGWTIDSTIDVTTLSPNEVTVLATAGIQINSDGTITFANARTEDMAGTTRGADYDAKDVSAAERATLAAAGIYLEGANGTSNNQLTLDDKLIRSAVTEAMFDMSGILGSQSAAAATILSGLIEVVDGNGNAVDYEKVSEGLGMFSEETGMFTLTNKAILSGEKTIADWFAEYESALTENGSVISESTKEALLALQTALTTDLNGTSTNGAVTFDWARGIGLTLEGSIDNFSEQTLATLREMGIELTDYDGQLKAVISNYSNELTDGTTVISSAEFAKLSDTTKTALKDMGVEFTEVGNWVAVDVSKTIGSSLDKLRAAYMVTPDAINNTSAAFQKWLQDIGMLDAENNLLQWNPQQSTYLSVVDENSTDEYNKRFATALQYADSALATLDNAAADSDLKKEYIANNLTYIDVLSYDAWKALDTNGDGIIQESEQVANGVAISLEEADADLVRQLAAHYGYAEDNVEQFKKDFAGISFKEATESQFLGVEDAYQGLFDELEAALAAGGSELEESAKQIAAAVRVALEESFNDIQYSAIKIKQENDNRGNGFLGIGNADVNDYMGYTHSPTDKWDDATKRAGYYNSYKVNKDNTEVYVDGTKYTVDTINVEDALMAVGRQLYGNSYKPGTNDESKSLRIIYKGVGYANGGIVEDDGLYRIAEQNRREAIIPLENPNVSAHIGAAMASMMLASEQWRRVAGLIGIQNGGMSSRITERPIVEQRSTDDMASTIVDTVLQRVIPAMAQQGSNAGATYEDTRTPVYVGTLIADDNGLRELNKRMQVIEAQEMRRR